MDLRMIKDIIRRKHQALTHEQIAKTLKVSVGVVCKYLSLDSAVGLDWPPDLRRQRWVNTQTHDLPSLDS
jgi:hypothetical protein